MLIDVELIKILACPVCHGALQEQESAKQLVCSNCHLGYPVRDGIPVMLVDEAVKLSK